MSMAASPLPDAHSGTAKRQRRIFSALGTSIFGKGSVLLVTALSVPITVRYLGAEQYGIWITISTTISMLVYLDIGIANTLTNLISEAYAKKDRQSATHYFATAFWFTVVLSLALGGIGWLVWPHLHIPSLLGVRDAFLIPEVTYSVIVAAICALAGLPGSLAAKALAGYQELHIANMFTAGANLLALGAIVAVVLLKGSLFGLVATYAATILVGSVGCLLWVSLVSKPWLMPRVRDIRPSLARRVFGSGGQFFLIQLSGLVVFNSDNLVISHYLSPAEVTPYNVTWRLVTYASAFQVLASQSLWPAYAEAWTKRQMQWIGKTYSRVRWATFATLAIAAAILIPFGRTIIRLWAGPSAVPSFRLLLLMCVWMAIFAITTNQACLLGATNRTGKQAISSSLAAALNLALSIYWVRTMGSFGALLGTVVSYVLFILLVQAIEVRSILRTSAWVGKAA
jgi:O-antigen/teichoic acid export membrane protein